MTACSIVPLPCCLAGLSSFEEQLNAAIIRFAPDNMSSSTHSNCRDRRSAYLTFFFVAAALFYCRIEQFEEQLNAAISRFAPGNMSGSRCGTPTAAGFCNSLTSSFNNRDSVSTW
jgi:hypothetical protein